MFLVNGRPGGSIDIADRGFNYGDGLFETLAVSDGRPLFLTEHLQRLRDGCERLLIPCPDAELLAAELRQCAAGRQSAVLKLVVSRGVGGRGYRQPETIVPTRVCSAHPWPVYPHDFQQQGAALRFCRQTLTAGPALAGIKHLNRLEQVLARAEWCGDDVQEGLMLDERGLVIEGTMSNLFVVRAGGLLTPALDRCGVAGIVRALLLRLAAREGLPLTVGAVSREAVLQADELFVCNSVIGIWPVVRLADRSWRPGPLTRRLQAGYAGLCRAV